MAGDRAFGMDDHANADVAPHGAAAKAVVRADDRDHVAETQPVEVVRAGGALVEELD